MNLEDYAYNEGDRWYIDPQVSLDEQNAFINNLRGLQAQDNAQIERQTRALGTQVPSQLGGLVGAGSYFRSRYQTPQTNQTVADLRAVAQAKALETAISNEIAKKQKQYKDAYRAAQERESNKNTTSASPLYDQLEGGLKTNTETTDVDQDNWTKYNDDEGGPGRVTVENGLTLYTDWAGRKYILFSDPGAKWAIKPDLTGKTPAHATIVEGANGKQYFYNAQNGQWYLWGGRFYD